MLMRIETPRPTLAERGLAAVSRAARTASRLAAAAAAWPARAAEHRRVMAALAGLSDHDLRDIGLTRGDIRDATGLEFDRDPGAFLAGRRSATHRLR